MRKRFWASAGLFVILASAAASSHLYASLGDGHHGEAMIRLEDVGPGEPYITPEELGKLRAVADYLYDAHVPFQVAVIPKYVAYEGNGRWVIRQIGGQDPSSRAFTGLLKYMESRGGVLGMHGYTHQVGDAPRADGWENSGIGREFVVPGAPFTFTPEYAAQRIRQSYALFERAGIRPAFWESPHYAADYPQEEVFRSFIGIIHEPDFGAVRSLKDVVYLSGENTAWGAPSLGAVYVPAPLRYIDGNKPAASVRSLLAQINGYSGLAGFFYHPYLEFPFLEPVTRNGKPVDRDGLPEFRYRPGSESYLHQLIEGFYHDGYRFVSIRDLVPFMPSYRFVFRQEDGLPVTGDVDGDGRTDIVQYQPATGRVWVMLNHRAPWRNAPQDPSVVAGDTGVKDAVPLMPADSEGKAEGLVLFQSRSGDWFFSRYVKGRFLPGAWFARLGQAGDIPVIGAFRPPPDGQDAMRTWIPCVIDPGKGTITWLAEGTTRTMDNPVLRGNIQVAVTPPSPRRAQSILVYRASDGEVDRLDLQGDGQWLVRHEGAVRAGGKILAGRFRAAGDDGIAVFLPSRGMCYRYRLQAGVWQEQRNAFGPWAAGSALVVVAGDFDGDGLDGLAVVRRAADRFIIDTTSG